MVLDDEALMTRALALAQ